VTAGIKFKKGMKQDAGEFIDQIDIQPFKSLLLKFYKGRTTKKQSYQ